MKKSLHIESVAKNNLQKSLATRVPPFALTHCLEPPQSLAIHEGFQLGHNATMRRVAPMHGYRLGGAHARGNGSVNTHHRKEDDDDRRHDGEGYGDDPEVFVSLSVGDAHDHEQGDDRPGMGERVQSARRHRTDSV